MLTLNIPGKEKIAVCHLLLDYNGTLACDGQIKTGVLERLEKLSEHVNIHVITADTFGSVHEQCDKDFITIHIISKEAQDKAKLDYLNTLGAEQTVAVGNGLNDALILKHAALGFALLQEEGCFTGSLLSSDVIFKSINDALDALLYPDRLVATLRS